MTRTLLRTRVSLAELVLDQATSTDLAEWVRVALWCWARADEHGHARAYAGQLRRDLTIPSAKRVTKALALAREHGVIDVCSTAECVVLPGHALAPCEARHRATP